jgi:hypothetical protein
MQEAAVRSHVPPTFSLRLCHRKIDNINAKSSNDGCDDFYQLPGRKTSVGCVCACVARAVAFQLKRHLFFQKVKSRLQSRTPSIHQDLAEHKQTKKPIVVSRIIWHASESESKTWRKCECKNKPRRTGATRTRSVKKRKMYARKMSKSDRHRRFAAYY